MSKKIKIKITEGGCSACDSAAPNPASSMPNAHNGEEARMHRTTLAHLIADVKVLLDLVQDGDDLPEWLETKITKAGDYMSSAARYVAGNIAREQGQLEEAKNCGRGKDPCITYGTLQEQIETKQLRALAATALRNLLNNLENMEEADLEKIVNMSTPDAGSPSNAMSEGIVGLTEEILIESHFTLYDHLQNAIDENGETPCPQCLYEVLSEASCGCPDLIPEAKYRGRKVTLNKPSRGDVKKFKVFVRDRKTGNVKKVNFGQKGMSIGRNDPARRRSFNARMGAILKEVKGQKTLSPAYWSLQAWKKGFKI